MKIEDIMIDDWHKAGQDIIILGPDCEEELDTFDLNKSIEEKLIADLVQKANKQNIAIELKNGKLFVNSSELNKAVKFLKENSVFVSKNDEDISEARSSGCIPDPGNLGVY